jgi:hypothetical protein
MRSFMTCTDQTEMSGTCSTTGKMHTIFWPGNLKVRDHLEDLGVDGRIILEWILWKYGKCGMDASGSG